MITVIIWVISLILIALIILVILKRMMREDPDLIIERTQKKLQNSQRDFSELENRKGNGRE
ncbi:MAG: hypothetical protein R6U96_15480 [Promethearchaeia archaeon]